MLINCFYQKVINNCLGWVRMGIVDKKSPFFLILSKCHVYVKMGIIPQVKKHVLDRYVNSYNSPTIFPHIYYILLYVCYRIFPPLPYGLFSGMMINNFTIVEDYYISHNLPPIVFFILLINIS